MISIIDDITNDNFSFNLLLLISPPHSWPLTCGIPILNFECHTDTLSIFARSYRDPFYSSLCYPGTTSHLPLGITSLSLFYPLGKTGGLLQVTNLFSQFFYALFYAYFVSFVIEALTSCLN